MPNVSKIWPAFGHWQPAISSPVCMGHATTQCLMLLKRHSFEEKRHDNNKIDKARFSNTRISNRPF
jgi:hypothetical protein